MKKICVSYMSAVAFLLLGLYITTLFTVQENKDSIKMLDTKTDKVVEINIEDFIIGVVSGEMPSDFETEALKAQAVAARTYVCYKMQQEDKHNGADICNDSTHCCAYYSEAELKDLKGEEWMKSGYEKIKKCVKETKGEIVTYEKKPILAVFHSAAGGGRTENSEDVWSKELPYLRSVATTGEQNKTNWHNTITYSTDDFKKRVKENYENANFEGNLIGEIKKTKGGAVDTIFICGIVMRGVEVRKIFGLKSACFDVEEKGKEIIFTTAGSGHGVGMSQYGANYMAQQGSTYKEILSKYYTNTVIMNIKDL